MNNAKTWEDRLAKIEWRGLVSLSPAEKLWELTLPLPWIGASLWAYDSGRWGLGLVAAFFFFLTGLRQSHNAQHYAIGIGRWAQDVVLCALSVLMLASMHAVQVTHLHHHRHCLRPEDVEGATARLPWWRALLGGPAFIVGLHREAWRLATPEKRRWIATELALVAGWLAVVWGILDAPFLRWHTAAMLIGECFTGFFAVWTVHHDCADRDPLARTQRGALFNAISYSMFFHLEHHLFPAVPTCHLARLARAVEAVAPELRDSQVVPFGHGRHA